MLRLIDEANGVPVIFAVITSTGYVVLEEFTDATRSLQLGVSQPKAHASQGQECCAQHEKQDTVAPEGIVPHDDEAEMEEGDDENGEGEAISIHGEGSSEDDDLVVEEITLSQPSS